MIVVKLSLSHALDRLGSAPGDRLTQAREQSRHLMLDFGEPAAHVDTLLDDAIQAIQSDPAQAETGHTDADTLLAWLALLDEEFAYLHRVLRSS